MEQTSLVLVLNVNGPGALYFLFRVIFSEYYRSVWGLGSAGGLYAIAIIIYLLCLHRNTNELLQPECAQCGCTNTSYVIY
jgi:hypothetical protein